MQCPGGSGSFDTFTTSRSAPALSRPDSEVLGVKERPDDEQLLPFLLLAVPSCQRSGSCLPNLEYLGSGSKVLPHSCSPPGPRHCLSLWQILLRHPLRGRS